MNIYVTVKHKESIIPYQTKVALRMDESKESILEVANEFRKDIAKEENEPEERLKMDVFVRHQDLWFKCDENNDWINNKTED